MLTFKKIVSLVLTLVVLVGLGGCGRTAQSSEAESVVSNELTSSDAYVPQDRFEDENIINTECTREKLAQTPIFAKSSESEYWAISFWANNYQNYSIHSISVSKISHEDNPISKFYLFEYGYWVETFSARFKTNIALHGLTPDKDGFYSFEFQLVTEHKTDCVTLMGYVTSQTNQITTIADLTEFLSVIRNYKYYHVMPEPSKSNVPESGWFGEGPIINLAYTRASLSENPVTTQDDTFWSAWVDFFVRGNYDSSAWGTTYSQHERFTLDTVDGKKEYFSAVICHTEFKSDTVPEGLEIDDGRYQISFQMVVKTGKTYYEGPFTLIGFVTNQDRQIVEACELYDFVKGMSLFEDTDFIAPEPLKMVRLNSLGYDFKEKIVDEATGLSVVNLRALTSGLEVDELTFFPGNLMAILVRNPDIKGKKILMVFEAKELRFLYQQNFTVPDDGYIRFENFNGTLALVQTPDYKNYKYFIPTESGILEIPEPAARYRLSNTAFIIEEKNSLILEQNGARKMLLKGLYPESPEDDDTSWENYSFFSRISDTRFIYELYGYESYNECGIYDIETGEKTVFTHENAPLLNIWSYTDGKAILFPDDWSHYESYGPYLYDEATRELIDLDLLDSPSDDVFSRFYFFGDTLGAFIEDEPFSTFSFYNLTSRTEIIHINILYTRAYYGFSSGLWHTENYIWFNSTAYFPEDYLLRIPIER